MTSLVTSSFHTSFLACWFQISCSYIEHTPPHPILHVARLSYFYFGNLQFSAMRLFLLSIFSSLVAAINITHPVANSTLAAGGSSKIAWTHVDTDPESLSLYLVNFVNWPPSYVPLAFDEAVADGSANVHIPCDTPPSWGYQINAINGTNVYVIYAQSAKFFISPAISPDTCIDENLPAPSECVVEKSPETTTVFVTVSSASTNSSRPLTAQHPEHTNPGIVPKTIGWRSGYEDPVTLSDIPTSSRALTELGTARPTNDLKPIDTEVVTVTEWVGVQCE